MQEIWKEYKTRKTHFKVSNMGNVEVIKWNARTDLDNIVYIDNRGRRCIGSQRFPVYLMVDRLFRGDKPKWINVHHINENKLDDRLENLVRITAAEHMTEHLTGKPSRNKGNKPWNFGLTKENNESLTKMGKHLSELKSSSEYKESHPVSESVKIRQSEYSSSCRWFTDGNTEKFVPECPEGFVPGRIKKHKNNDA